MHPNLFYSDLGLWTFITLQIAVPLFFLMQFVPFPPFESHFLSYKAEKQLTIFWRFLESLLSITDLPKNFMEGFYGDDKWWNKGWSCILVFTSALICKFFIFATLSQVAFSFLPLSRRRRFLISHRSPHVTLGLFWPWRPQRNGRNWPWQKLFLSALLNTKKGESEKGTHIKTGATFNRRNH